MAKKRLEQCRSGNDFIKYAEKAGADVYGGGRHIKVKTAKGRTVVPLHPGDLGKGLRFTLMKQFVALGIVIFLLFCSSLFVIGQIVNPPMMLVP